MLRRRNRLADSGDGEAEQLEREQRPGDALQAIGVGGDERIALRTVSTIASSRLRTTWLSGTADEAEHRDRAQPHDHLTVSRTGVMPSAVKVHSSATMVAISRARIAAPDSQLSTIRMRR